MKTHHWNLVVLLLVLTSPRRRSSCLALTLTNRRDAFRRAAVTFLVTTTSPTIYNEAAVAVGEGEQRMILTRQPKAPTGALLPAAQQRLLLEKCRVLAADLANADSEREETTIRQLQSILVALEDDNDAASSSNKKRNNNKDLNTMLKKSPAKVLSGDLVRAAMNIYTANLSYGEAYAVTDPNWKKNYIRANDGLPDIKQVIVADLDLRDLYRNQVQLRLDDASAELYSPTCDIDELQSLLREAAESFDQWLGMISNADVTEALQAALEGKSLQVYDSFYAGFVPPKP